MLNNLISLVTLIVLAVFAAAAWWSRRAARQSLGEGLGRRLRFTYKGKTYSHLHWNAVSPIQLKSLDVSVHDTPVEWEESSLDAWIRSDGSLCRVDLSLSSQNKSIALSHTACTIPRSRFMRRPKCGRPLQRS
jgi:hypothetical protein